MTKRPSQSDDLTGITLDDRYHVVRRIGRGGMGEVYEARQLRLNRRVAVKVPRSGVLLDDAFRHRFNREAHSLARVQHENICQIFDVYVGRDVDEVSYLVMEYVEGERLDRWLHANLATLKIGDFLEILQEIARALDHAHTFNVVHRDIKPSNILITAERAPKIMDFGVAQIPDDHYQTVAGLAIGTPAFMAPEQVRGEQVGAKADQYGLAMTLYKIFTGTVAFKADRNEHLIYLQLHEPPTPPSKHNPNLPFPLELIILKGLAKDPAERFASCGAMIQTMELVLGDHLESPLYPLFPEAEEYGPERLKLDPRFDDLFGAPIWHRRYRRELMTASFAAAVLLLLALFWALTPPGDIEGRRIASPSPIEEEARLSDEGPEESIEPSELPSEAPKTASGESEAAPPDEETALAMSVETPELPEIRDEATTETMEREAAISASALPYPVTPLPTPLTVVAEEDGATTTDVTAGATAGGTTGPLILPSPTPLLGYDPTLLPRDDILQLDRYVLEESLADFLRRDFAEMIEREQRESFRRRLLLMPARRRETILGQYDATVGAYRDIRCTINLLEFRPGSDQTVEAFFDVTVRGVPEGAPSNAAPSIIFRKTEPQRATLESRAAEWYFLNFGTFLGEISNAAGG